MRRQTRGIRVAGLGGQDRRREWSAGALDAQKAGVKKFGELTLYDQELLLVLYDVTRRERRCQRIAGMKEMEHHQTDVELLVCRTMGEARSGSVSTLIRPVRSSG